MLQRQGRVEKKLADAARYWAALQRSQGAAPADGRAADPPELQEAIAAHDEAVAADSEEGDDVFVLWPENQATWQVFCALGNCWRSDGMSGQMLGLDRPAIESTLRLMQINRRRHRAILEDLIAMEAAALPVLNRPTTNH